MILAVLALAVALGAVVQGSIGFGYALLAVPAMALLWLWAVPVRPSSSPPMMALMSARGWRSIDMVGFFLITGGRLVGTVAGLVLLVLAPKGWLSALTGLLIVAVALGSFLKPSLEVDDRTGLPATWPRGWWAPSRPSAGHRFALVYQDRSGAELVSTLASHSWSAS